MLESGPLKGRLGLGPCQCEAEGRRRRGGTSLLRRVPPNEALKMPDGRENAENLIVPSYVALQQKIEVGG